MYFDDSRPDRQKRAKKLAGANRVNELISSPIPPTKHYELLSYSELISGGDRILVADVESYPNYFEVGFKCIASQKVLCFEDDYRGYVINNCVVDAETWLSNLNYIIARFLIVGFKSRTYDMPIIYCALQGVRCATLNTITDEIINQELQAYEVERKYCVNVPKVNHIDLIDVAPITASLKIYAGRLHCERMQDLPFPPFTILSAVQSAYVRDYNVNDLDNTELVFNYLKPQIELREQLGLDYGVDLRSKSDAQIAETVIVSELNKLGTTGKKPNIELGTQFYYQVPGFIKFQTPVFQNVLKVVAETPFTVGASGSADCPQAIAALKPKLGLGTYRLGVGGLHSSEESVCYQADENTLLIDRDVASYYPAIILNLQLYPQHLGPDFLKVYRSLVTKRLLAKKEGNKTVAESLKIVINGSFGKLGNHYSKLYAPDLLTQVTMTGQLALLMLIEMVELAGIPVISANTDGIVMKVPPARYGDLDMVVMQWENATGFDTEETQYKGLYSRDVNNYIAVKLDGEIKTKGVFSERGSALNSVLSKNPESYICSLAVQAFLANDVPIADTIHQCRDIRKFVNVRTVKGGAEKNGVYLGKAIRWYYARGETGTINYVLSGNKVPKSDGAKPLMIMPDSFPADLDVDKYINEATEILYDIGYFQRAKTPSLL